MDGVSENDRRAVPLASLRRGARAALHRRLMPPDQCSLVAAMGLCDDCSLRVCRAGEPCIVQVAGTRLGLSAGLARCILVVPARDDAGVATGPAS